MRPGQQNKRGRGRGNGSNNNNNNNNNNGNFNRKGQNPLTRTYDSSGPDIKIRGTAQHIAEKYAALARDAQSAGDRVMAENYLQHAEHYNRIIAAAQAQMQERFQRDDRNDAADRDGFDRDEEGTDSGYETEAVSQGSVQHQPSQPQAQPTVAPVRTVAVDGSGPQPVIDDVPAEVVAAEEEAAAGGGRERSQRRRSGGQRPRRAPRAKAEDGDAGPEAAPVAEVAE